MWTGNFQMFKLVLEKAEEPEIKLPTSTGSWKSKRVPEKHLFLLIDYAKAFDCVNHNKLWKILQEIEIPDHLTCLQRNLYAGQESAVRTRHGIMDCWISLQSKGLSRVFSNTTVQKHQFFIAPSLIYSYQHQSSEMTYWSELSLLRFTNHTITWSPCVSHSAY